MPSNLKLVGPFSAPDHILDRDLQVQYWLSFRSVQLIGIHRSDSLGQQYRVCHKLRRFASTVVPGMVQQIASFVVARVRSTGPKNEISLVPLNIGPWLGTDKTGEAIPTSKPLAHSIHRDTQAVQAVTPRDKTSGLALRQKRPWDVHDYLPECRNALANISSLSWAWHMPWQLRRCA
jgi:hypothetical protein